MKYTNKMGAVRTAWIIVAMVTGGVTAARAGAITYNINFTGTSADLPVGSFTYDSAAPAFTSFSVLWNGLSFDLTSSANSPFDDGASGPACLGGLTGAAASFAWLNPGCQTFPSGWVGDTTPSGSGLFASFNFPEQNNSLQIGVHSIGADTAVDDDTTDRGAFTISPAVTGAPEPATFFILSSGLGLLFLVRRSLTPKRMKTSLLIGAAACLGYGPVAHASMITYTEQATMTGFLGATTFTNALVTISVNADTSNITIPFPNTFFNIGGAATLTIAGIGGIATFTDTMMGRGQSRLPDFR